MYFFWKNEANCFDSLGPISHLKIHWTIDWWKLIDVARGTKRCIAEICLPHRLLKEGMMSVNVYMRFPFWNIPALFNIYHLNVNYFHVQDNSWYYSPFAWCCHSVRLKRSLYTSDGRRAKPAFKFIFCLILKREGLPCLWPEIKPLATEICAVRPVYDWPGYAWVREIWLQLTTWP